MKTPIILIVERARRYIAKMPEAISGQHGHSTMFSVACVLVQGFDLNMGDARTLLEEYNVTLTEPFSRRELEHKLQCAAKKESAKGRGYLLNSSDKSIRVRITPKKPADTPPRIIHQIPSGTPRTGVSFLFRKTKHKYTTIQDTREIKTGVLPVLEQADGKETTSGELEEGVLPVPKGQEAVEDALPTLSSTGVLSIPFNAPVCYRYWLRGTSFEQSAGQILSLEEIRESLLCNFHTGENE
ncbi:MAG: hypothetical protein VB862_08770 [Pirellulaceae bacterium]